MKLKVYPVLLLIAVAAVTSCSKKSNPNPVTPSDPKPTGPNQTPVWPTDADVYFVGTSHDSHSDNIATYWKNGVATTLSSDRSQANGIAVNGTDVYIVGTTSVGTYAVATLWKNGMPTELAGHSVSSEAEGIVISNNDIYIVGLIDDKATYWKNGVSVPVTSNPLPGFYPCAIAVNGNDVYVAGNTVNSQAAYWKNGVLTQLTPINSGSITLASAIAVNGNDVYVTGYTAKGAALWKNNVAMTLSGNPEGSTASSVIIDGNDVYVGGINGLVATYWQNGVATTLPYGQDNVNAPLIIGLDGSNIYAAGGTTTTDGGGSIYWRNGVAYQFSKNLVMIYGMAIAPH